MKEFIERAAILQAIEESEPDVMADYGEYYGSEWGFSRSKLSEIIRGMPAADVAEVRHGYWKPYEAFPMAPSLNGYPCSECGMHFSPSAIPILKYCPNCGARMGKEDEHEAG